MKTITIRILELILPQIKTWCKKLSISDTDYQLVQLERTSYSCIEVYLGWNITYNDIKYQLSFDYFSGECLSVKELLVSDENGRSWKDIHLSMNDNI